MAFDRNPAFGKDQAFTEGARRVADMLWETTGGDLTAFPKSYLENLRHEYADGQLSMLELIDRVDLGPDAIYDDYCEVVEALLRVDSAHWPDPNAVVSIPANHLQYEIKSDFDFSEFDFEEEVIEEKTEVVTAPGQPGPDPLSEKMELFFKKVIASVYLDGVTSVTDTQGNPPNEANNYLMSDDGKEFTGVFYDSPPTGKDKQFPFTISEKEGGKWMISY